MIHYFFDFLIHLKKKKKDFSMLELKADTKGGREYEKKIIRIVDCFNIVVF